MQRRTIEIQKRVYRQRARQSQHHCTHRRSDFQLERQGMPVLISTEKQGHRAAVLSIAKRSLDDARRSSSQWNRSSDTWTNLSFESMENETIPGEPRIKTAT